MLIARDRLGTGASMPSSADSTRQQHLGDEAGPRTSPGANLTAPPCKKKKGNSCTTHCRTSLEQYYSSCTTHNVKTHSAEHNAKTRLFSLDHAGPLQPRFHQQAPTADTVEQKPVPPPAENSPPQGWREWPRRTRVGSRLAPRTRPLAWPHRGGGLAHRTTQQSCSRNPKSWAGAQNRTAELLKKRTQAQKVRRRRLTQQSC